MSGEVHTNSEENPTESLPSIEELAGQVKALNEQNAALAASKDRILEESKGYKAKLGEISQAQTEKEKAYAQEKDDFQKLYELEKQEKSEWVTRYGQMKETVSQKELDLKLTQLAPDARDYELLKASIKTDGLKWDDNLNLTGLEPEIERIRKDKNFLFMPDAPAKQFEKKAPGFNGASAEDKSDEAYFARLGACTTQKELDKVRKEFNRFFD